MMKGFRFHPTDAEAIELLWDKIILDRDSIVQVGDSLVQVITQLEDICEFEPGELPGRSEFDSGDKVWYFFCSPRYKYRNSKRKNRVTQKGYWNPTGKPREIVTTYDGKEITGSRQTLTFYRGRVGDKMKSENKTSWVIHEFELSLTLPNQKTLILSKLKNKYGKVDVSRGGGGQSSQGLPSNLGNHGTKNANPKEKLNPDNEPSTESEAFNECSGIQSQFSTDEQDDDQFVDSLFINNDELYSNQPYFVDENEGPKNQEGFGELITRKPKAPNDGVGSSEHDNSSLNSTLIADDQTYSKGGSASHFNTSFAANEGSSLAYENRVAEDSIPMKDSEFDEFLRDGIFMAELLPMPAAPITNEQDDEFWNSIFFTTDEVEAYPEVFRSKQQNLAALNEGFDFSSISTVETPNDPCPLKSIRKRPRIES